MKKVVIDEYPSIVVDNYIKTGENCYSNTKICRNM